MVDHLYNPTTLKPAFKNHRNMEKRFNSEIERFDKSSKSNKSAKSDTKRRLCVSGHEKQTSSFHMCNAPIHPRNIHTLTNLINKSEILHDQQPYYLCLRNNRTNTDISELLDNIPKYMIHIDLSFNKISSIHVHKFVDHLTNVQYLDLQNNSIGNEGLILLTTMFHRLFGLNVANNGITDISCITSVGKLKMLNLNKNMASISPILHAENMHNLYNMRVVDLQWHEGDHIKFIEYMRKCKTETSIQISRPYEVGMICILKELVNNTRITSFQIMKGYCDIPQEILNDIYKNNLTLTSFDIPNHQRPCKFILRNIYASWFCIKKIVTETTLIFHHLPAYIILEIIDWLPVYYGDNYTSDDNLSVIYRTNHYKKIKQIQSLQNIIRNILNKRLEKSYKK